MRPSGSGRRGARRVLEARSELQHNLVPSDSRLFGRSTLWLLPSAILVTAGAPFVRAVASIVILILLPRRKLTSVGPSLSHNWIRCGLHMCFPHPHHLVAKFSACCEPNRSVRVEKLWPSLKVPRGPYSSFSSYQPILLVCSSSPSSSSPSSPSCLSYRRVSYFP